MIRSITRAGSFLQRTLDGFSPNRIPHYWERIHGGMSVKTQLWHSRCDEPSNGLVVMKQPVDDKNEAASWVLQAAWLTPLALLALRAQTCQNW